MNYMLVNEVNDVISGHSTRKKAMSAAKRHVYRGLHAKLSVIDIRPEPNATGRRTIVRDRIRVVRTYSC